MPGIIGGIVSAIALACIPDKAGFKMDYFQATTS
jgi:hypothetical protein